MPTPRFHKARRKKWSLKIILRSILFVFAIALMTYRNSYIATKKSDEKALLKDLIPSNTDISFYLINENRFINTLKSCPDVKKCGHHKVSTNNDKNKIQMVQRVAIISPPSVTYDMLVSTIESALLVYYNFDSKTMDTEIEVISTSHVPPYGYGSNHGYTKIIRVISGSLLVDMMSWWVKTSNGSWDIETLQQALMLIIRWHCRLSHVAAHTTMYNLNISSNNILQEVKNVFKLIVDDPEQELSDATEKRLKEERLQKAYRTIEDSNFDLLVPSLLTDTNKEIHKLFLDSDNHKILSQVLLKELEATNDLKKWPCLSFWDTSSNDNKNIAPFAKQLAQQFIPDCSAPFTKCGVKRDRCEVKGDAECK